MASARRFYEIWTALTLALPWTGKGRDEAEMKATARLYQRMLADIDDDILQAAAEQLMQTSKFFPSIAELRAAAMAHLAPQRELALEAWGSVLELMRPSSYWPGKYAEMGPDGKIIHSVAEPTFVNPITERVVRAMGGFEKLQISTERGDEVSNRARFIEAYDQLARRERDETLALPDARQHQQLGDAKVAGLVGRVVWQLTGEQEVGA